MGVLPLLTALGPSPTALRTSPLLSPPSSPHLSPPLHTSPLLSLPLCTHCPKLEPPLSSLAELSPKHRPSISRAVLFPQDVQACLRADMSPQSRALGGRDGGTGRYGSHRHMAIPRMSMKCHGPVRLQDSPGSKESHHKTLAATWLETIDSDHSEGCLGPDLC